VAFLAGGHATAPLPDLQRVTVAAADALVAQLRGQGLPAAGERPEPQYLIRPRMLRPLRMSS
jgi:hypothetical protein